MLISTTRVNWEKKNRKQWRCPLPNILVLNFCFVLLAVDSEAGLYPLVVETQFKRPLFIPSTAVFKYRNIEPSVEATSSYMYKSNRSKTFAFRVLSGDVSGNETALSSLNMVGYATYNADIQP